mmetsp:Transcript_67816/g.100491  ORF Transcript_67816/g.100491 Transcript_67816/m.100491 type:complete len:201 (-) Transcript_67816:123-725(-)
MNQSHERSGTAPSLVAIHETQKTIKRCVVLPLSILKYHSVLCFVSRNPFFFCSQPCFIISSPVFLSLDPVLIISNPFGLGTFLPVFGILLAVDFIHPQHFVVLLSILSLKLAAHACFSFPLPLIRPVLFTPSVTNIPSVMLCLLRVFLFLPKSPFKCEWIFTHTTREVIVAAIFTANFRTTFLTSVRSCVCCHAHKKESK